MGSPLKNQNFENQASSWPKLAQNRPRAKISWNWDLWWLRKSLTDTQIPDIIYIYIDNMYTLTDEIIYPLIWNGMKKALICWHRIVHGIYKPYIGTLNPNLPEFSDIYFINTYCFKKLILNQQQHLHFSLCMVDGENLFTYLDSEGHAALFKHRVFWMGAKIIRESTFICHLHFWMKNTLVEQCIRN